MGLDTVELILETEKYFAITLSDKELENIETVESFCRLIRRNCVLKYGFKAQSYSCIYLFIVGLLHSGFGVPKEKIHPDSRIVKDLGLN